jgi:hypothetical protein
MRVNAINFFPEASRSSSHTTRFALGFGEFLLRGPDLNGLKYPPKVNTISLISLWVRIQGISCVRSHISLDRATANYFCNSFVFKNKTKKEGLPSDGPAGLGTDGL